MLYLPLTARGDEVARPLVVEVMIRALPLGGMKMAERRDPDRHSVVPLYAGVAEHNPPPASNLPQRKDLDIRQAGTAAAAEPSRLRTRA